MLNTSARAALHTEWPTCCDARFADDMWRIESQVIAETSDSIIAYMRLIAHTGDSSAFAAD